MPDKQLAAMLAQQDSEAILAALFGQYEINCMNMHRLDADKLDGLIGQLDSAGADKARIVEQMISLIRAVSAFPVTEAPIIDRIRSVLADDLQEELSAKEVAARVGISRYYLCHLFKKATGQTVTDYRHALRMEKARELLRHTDRKITDIARACGFDSDSYFSKRFADSEKVSPTRYRRLMKHTTRRDKDVIYDSMLPHVRLLDGVDPARLLPLPGMPTYAVTTPDETYRFLHEAAIIGYHGVLFAAWYNNGRVELHGETPIRFSRSRDGGVTWEAPTTVAIDPTGSILYCPPVFGIQDDRLYMLLNQMVAADHIHALDLYVYDETAEQFTRLWTRPLPFKLNTNVCALPGGRLLLPGRTGELDGFPATPAVLIAEEGRLDGVWRMVKLQEDSTLADGARFVHPELSLLPEGEQLLGFCRNDPRKVPLVYRSADGGEHWTGPYAHDIPFSSSKIYSGTLTDGRRYVIGNLEPGRTKLAIFFGKAGGTTFDRGYILQNGVSAALGYGTAWHYPAACEMDGKLYVIYTVTVDGDNRRGAVVSVIDLRETE